MPLPQQLLAALWRFWQMRGVVRLARGAVEQARGDLQRSLALAAGDVQRALLGDGRLMSLEQAVAFARLRAR